MHHNTRFAEFILDKMNYAAYPELIEFYTGIDRRRDNALKIIEADIRETCDLVEKKCGLPVEFNIYDLAQWIPSSENIEEMHEEVASGALSSNLPESVKDEYADQGYNRSRPLNQSIHQILEEYSLLRLMKGVQAGCKALRNSDYSEPETRHALLQQILRSWEQIIKVLIVLTPVMSKDGYAKLEGATFILHGKFNGTDEEKFNQIIQLLPINVVNWYRDDLFSKKMGPLLFKHINDEENSLIRHVLNLLVVNKRPKGWEDHIEKYIVSENKNSFYLLDIYSTLRAEYQYSFARPGELNSLSKLIKMSVAKHKLGIKKPGRKVLKDEKLSAVLPVRDTDLE